LTISAAKNSVPERRLMVEDKVEFTPKLFMKNFLTDTSPEYVGKRLEIFRLAVGVKQVELAREFGWSQQKLGQWEHGRRNPTVPDMIDLAERYGVTLDYIYRGDMSRLPEWLGKKIRELVVQDPLVGSASGTSRPGADHDKVGDGQ
jgi:transcriptional regulator with XRE-family HTH domain